MVRYWVEEPDCWMAVMTTLVNMKVLANMKAPEKTRSQVMSKVNKMDRASWKSQEKPRDRENTKRWANKMGMDYNLIAASNWGRG